MINRTVLDIKFYSVCQFVLKYTFLCIYILFSNISNSTPSLIIPSSHVLSLLIHTVLMKKKFQLSHWFMVSGKTWVWIQTVLPLDPIHTLLMSPPKSRKSIWTLIYCLWKCKMWWETKFSHYQVRLKIHKIYLGENSKSI